MQFLNLLVAFLPPFRCRREWRWVSQTECWKVQCRGFLRTWCPIWCLWRDLDAFTQEEALDGISKIAHDVPTIGHLPGLWGSLPPSIGIGTTTIPTQDLNFRVSREP